MKKGPEAVGINAVENKEKSPRLRGSSILRILATVATISAFSVPPDKAEAAGVGAESGTNRAFIECVNGTAEDALANVAKFFAENNASRATLEKKMDTAMDAVATGRTIKRGKTPSEHYTDLTEDMRALQGNRIMELSALDGLADICKQAAKTLQLEISGSESTNFDNALSGSEYKGKGDIEILRMNLETAEAGLEAVEAFQKDMLEMQ